MALALATGHAGRRRGGRDHGDGCEVRLHLVRPAAAVVLEIEAVDVTTTEMSVRSGTGWSWLSVAPATSIENSSEVGWSDESHEQRNAFPPLTSGSADASMSTVSFPSSLSDAAMLPLTSADRAQATFSPLPSKLPWS